MTGLGVNFRVSVKPHVRLESKFGQLHTHPPPQFVLADPAI